MASTEEADATWRPGRAGDAAALSELAFRSKAHWGYDDAFMRRCRAELSLTPEEVVGFPTRVVELEGELIGFCQLCPKQEAAEIAMLFVAPEAMGNGIGSGLLAWALGEARARGWPWLDVESDPQAEDFYRARGARRIGDVASGSVPGRRLPLLRFG